MRQLFHNCRGKEIRTCREHLTEFNKKSAASFQRLAKRHRQPLVRGGSSFERQVFAYAVPKRNKKHLSIPTLSAPPGGQSFKRIFGVGKAFSPLAHRKRIEHFEKKIEEQRNDDHAEQP
ncbi:colicin-like pore-forming protein [Paenibacillus sp. GCM10027627]|uniref:colicin-like pore-forming protein n=1 Tax=Paenibacillus sp. GCM10027627 TaxID=3273412 RepID=UPI003634DB3A